MKSIRIKKQWEDETDIWFPFLLLNITKNLMHNIYNKLKKTPNGKHKKSKELEPEETTLLESMEYNKNPNIHVIIVSDGETKQGIKLKKNQWY